MKASKRCTVEELVAKVKCTAGGCYFELPGQIGKTSSVARGGGEGGSTRKGGLVDPLDWLEKDRAETLRNLAAIRKPEHLWEDIVTACHRVPVQEEASMARKLLETGIAVLVPELDPPHDSEGRLLVGGRFCVAKNDQADRLIFDRRPETATMERLRWAQLPSGARFTRMLLKANEYVRESGDDLRNFYYMLLPPPDWVRYNSVGKRVDPQVVSWSGASTLFQSPGDMGDINGHDVAQATHESILRKHNVLSPSTNLVCGQHVPQGDLWTGAYLDDLLIMKKCQVEAPVRLDGSFIPPEPCQDAVDVVKVAAAESAYAEAGLKCAEHKACRQATYLAEVSTHSRASDILPRTR